MSNRIFRKNSVPQSSFWIPHIRRIIPQPRHLNRATFFPTLKYMRSQSRRRRREAIQVTKESPTFPPRSTWSRGMWMGGKRGIDRKEKWHLLRKKRLIQVSHIHRGKRKFWHIYQRYVWSTYESPLFTPCCERYTCIVGENYSMREN